MSVSLILEFVDSTGSVVHSYYNALAQNLNGSYENVSIHTR